jgi:hypothetical protein
MKKFSFNFGKAAALVLGVTAFLFAGCDQSLAGGGVLPTLDAEVKIVGNLTVNTELEAVLDIKNTAQQVAYNSPRTYKWYRSLDAEADNIEWIEITNVDGTPMTEEYTLVGGEGGDLGCLIKVEVTVTGYRNTLADETAMTVQEAGTPDPENPPAEIPSENPPESPPAEIPPEIPADTTRTVVLFKSGVKVDAAYTDTLDGAFEYIKDEAESNDEYLIQLNADQYIKPFYMPQGDARTGIKITLQGNSDEKKIAWAGASDVDGDGDVDGDDELASKSTYNSGAALFIIKNNNSLILDNNITLDGKNKVMYCNYTTDTNYSNNNPAVGASGSGKSYMVSVGGGTLTMKEGSKIVRMGWNRFNNIGPAAVMVNSGIFLLDGGEISEINNNSYTVVNEGTFQMKRGAIKNTGETGMACGVNNNSGDFIMDGGEISGNAGAKTGNGIRGGGGRASINNGTIKNWAIGIMNEGTGATCIITINGGSITDCNAGLYDVKTGGSNKIILKGGTIKNNTICDVSHITKQLVLDGTDIGSICLFRASTANGTIYVGDNFNPGSPVSIDIVSSNAADLATTGTAKGWGTARLIMKGGTPENTTTITETQLAKFTAGKGGYYTDIATLTVVETGHIELSFGGDSYGYAKWVAN